MNDNILNEWGEFSEAEIDALAYSYVLSHGYEGALSMLDGFFECRCGNGAEPDDALASLSRRIVDAIHDEAATISRILDRIMPALRDGALDHLAALSLPPRNPIDRHIGNRLRQRRSQLGISLASLAADLALKLNELVAIEEGVRRLDEVELKRAIERLDVHASYFCQASCHDNEGTSMLR